MTPTETCLAYLRAYATGDVDQVVQWVTEDYVNDHTTSLGKSFTSRDVFRQELERFIQAMPGMHYDVEHTITEGDRVAIAYTMRARPRGRFVSLRGTMHFEVRDGLIAKRTDYWDSATFGQQVGLG